MLPPLSVCSLNHLPMGQLHQALDQLCCSRMWLLLAKALVISRMFCMIILQLQDVWYAHGIPSLCPIIQMYVYMQTKQRNSLDTYTMLIKCSAIQHASSYNVIDYAEISGDGYYGHLYLMLFADLFVARSWFDTLHEKLYLPS